MRVIFPVRRDAFDKPGGDIVQLKAYIAALSLVGIEGVMTNKIFVSLRDFDIVHLSNIDRPLETFWYYYLARRAKKPAVLSPIHHPLNAVDMFEANGRLSWKFRLLNRTTNHCTREMIKNVVRTLQRPSLLAPLTLLILTGYSNAQRKLFDSASFVLLSEKERLDLQKDMDIQLPSCFVLRNRIDNVLLAEIFKVRQKTSDRNIDFLCVGRIEPRKNQLRVLRAAEAKGFTVCFVGAMTNSDQFYCQLFEQELKKSKSIFLGSRTRLEVVKLMCQSKVHISASWFEVASLVDLEANAAGAVILSSVNGSTNEILDDKACLLIYPEDEKNISDKMSEALQIFSDVNRRDTYASHIPEEIWIRPLAELYSSLSVARSLDSGEQPSKVLRLK